MANASLCVSRFSCLSQDLQGIIAWVLEADVVVGWGLYHKLERMAILQLLS